MLRSHSLGEHSVFEKTLEAGLSAMKTHQCFLDKTKSNGCPGKVLSFMKSDLLHLNCLHLKVYLNLDESLLGKT